MSINIRFRAPVAIVWEQEGVEDLINMMKYTYQQILKHDVLNN